MLTIERVVIVLLLLALAWCLWRLWQTQSPRPADRQPWFLALEMGEIKPNFILIVVAVLFFFVLAPLVGIELPEQVYLIFIGGLIARLADLLVPKKPSPGG